MNSYVFSRHLVNLQNTNKPSKSSETLSPPTVDKIKRQNNKYSSHTSDRIYCFFFCTGLLKKEIVLLKETFFLEIACLPVCRTCYQLKMNKYY